MTKMTTFECWSAEVGNPSEAVEIEAGSPCEAATQWFWEQKQDGEESHMVYVREPGQEEDDWRKFQICANGKDAPHSFAEAEELLEGLSAEARTVLRSVGLDSPGDVQNDIDSVRESKNVEQLLSDCLDGLDVVDGTEEDWREYVAAVASAAGVAVE